MPIETSRTQQSGVQRFGAIGRGDHDHATVGIKAVHFNQQRIECLFSFVMPTNRRSAAAFAQRVKFVDEDDARGAANGLLEHVSHTSSADVHLNKIAARQTEKRNTGFAGDRPGKQGLARSRRSNKQNALGDSSAQSLVFLTVF